MFSPAHFRVMAALDFSTKVYNEVTIQFTWTDFHVTEFVFAMGIISCFFGLVFLIGEVMGKLKKLEAWDANFVKLQLLLDYVSLKLQKLLQQLKFGLLLCILHLALFVLPTFCMPSCAVSRL